MATINYRLQKIAEELFIKYGSKERLYIDERIKAFQKTIKGHFGDDISEIIIFGSYMRDTILPRQYDPYSDIDVLIVFNQKKKERTSETYRDQIRKFAKKKYFATPVVKDHPSVVLEMSGIKFDLVPCRIDKGIFFDDYQIPAKDGSWMNTEPIKFTQELTKVNNRYNSIVKPIIRLMKCWNAFNDHPYSSFELEGLIADMNFNNDSYQTGFLYAVKNLPTYNLAEYSKRKVENLKNYRKEIIDCLEAEKQDKAEELLLKLLGLK